MVDFLRNLLGGDLETAGLIILNLIIIESLLSVDNAAVLATMVMDLPKHQRAKALRYGLIGAYIFRGLCLLFASYLIKVKWLKGLSGIYLLWLAFNFFKQRVDHSSGKITGKKEDHKVYKFLFGKLGMFWSTVVLVESMDLAFSIDNVFAAVAFTRNIYLVWIGVFIGIFTMRLVAQGFVKMMEKFPFLNVTAFIVIGLLGCKLTASFLCEIYPDNMVCHFLNSKNSDMYFSIFTVGIFILPVIISLLFRKNSA